MPQKNIPENLYIENILRNEEEKNKIIEKTTTNNVQNQKKENIKTKQERNDLNKKQISIPKNNIEEDLKKEIEIEKKIIEKRLIFDFENIFSLSEIKEIHQIIEKIYYKTDILIFFISNFEKNDKKVAVQNSILKYFSKSEKNIILLERKSNKLNFYLLNKSNNEFLIKDIENTNILQEKSYFDEIKNVLYTLGKIDINQIILNNYKINKFDSNNKIEKNNKNKIIFFSIIFIILLVLYIIIEIIFSRSKV